MTMTMTTMTVADLNPKEIGTQTKWRLQSTMSGTYLTSAHVEQSDGSSSSTAYLKAHETTAVEPGARESFVIEATDESTYFHIRAGGEGYLVVEDDSGYVTTTGSPFEASKFQLMSPGFQRADLDEMIKSASYRRNYDDSLNAMAKASVATNHGTGTANANGHPAATAAPGPTVLLPAVETQAGTDGADDGDEWELVEMTEKMTDDVMTVSTFEYQRRYPFQGWCVSVPVCPCFCMHVSVGFRQRLFVFVDGICCLLLLCALGLCCMQFVLLGSESFLTQCALTYTLFHPLMPTIYCNTHHTTGSH